MPVAASFERKKNNNKNSNWDPFLLIGCGWGMLGWCCWIWRVETIVEIGDLFFWWGLKKVFARHTGDGRNPIPNHLECRKPCKSWDNLPTSTGERWISEPSTRKKLTWKFNAKGSMGFFLLTRPDRRWGYWGDYFQNATRMEWVVSKGDGYHPARVLGYIYIYV